MNYRASALAMLAALAVGLPAHGDVAALVSALESKDADVRHAAYETAGQYGPEAIGPVAPLLDSDNVPVVRAAKIALEKIAGAATRDELSCPEAGQALCIAAMSVKNPEWLLWLLSYTGGKEALPSLLVLLDERPESFDAVLMAIQGIAVNGPLDAHYGPRLVEKLVKKMLEMEGQKRVALINALGAIGHSDAVSILTEEARPESPTAIPAIEALGSIGNPKPAAFLLERYQETGLTAALDAYLRIAERQPARDAADLYQKLLDVEPKTASGGADAVAAEGPAARVSDFSRYAAVKCAALHGLGRAAAKKKAIRTIVPYLDAERADVHGAAMVALIDLEGDRATQTLVRMTRKATPAMKTDLLEILAERDPEIARNLLDRALEDPSSEVRIAALRLLGQSADLAHEDTFLEAAKGASENARPVALEGYLHLAASVLAGGDTAKALDMYHAALELAERPEERLAALQGLTQIADPSTLDRLSREGLRDAPALEVPVDTCALAIAATLHESDAEKAKDTYAAVLERTSDRGIANRAAQGLQALGVERSFAAEAGFITNWQIIAPFHKESFAKAYPPETEYTPGASYPGAGDQQAAWKAHHVDDVMGVTELDAMFTPNDNVIAYARAEVSVDATRDVLVKMGSDDGIVAWVNGEKIHENDTARAVGIDADTKPATLNAGTNVILIKIVQGGGNWGFCVRLTDRNGRPLAFTN